MLIECVGLYLTACLCLCGSSENSSHNENLSLLPVFRVTIRRPCSLSRVCIMDRWLGRVALVTGGSAGIGAAIARRLTREGMTVVACSRNITSIEEMADDLKDQKGELHAMMCDLTDEAQILSMFSDIKKKFGGVDVCVNNAGLMAQPASLLSGSTDSWRETFNVNVLALMICTRETYRSLDERKVDDGHIFFLNSMSGHRVINNANNHVYSASKFAVTAIAEGVRNELREKKTNIRTTSISPGIVETEFMARSFDETTARSVYSSIQCLQADDIVDAVIYSLSAAPHVQVHDILIRPTEQVS